MLRLLKRLDIIYDDDDDDDDDEVCVFSRCFPSVLLNPNPWTVYNHIDAVKMYSD